WVGNLNPNQKRVLGSVKRDLEITRGFLYRNGTSINAIDDDFDPGRSLFGQKRQQALPIVGRAVWKPKKVLIFGLDCLTSQMPNLSWSSMINLADCGVESSHGTEARCVGDLTHRQSCLVDEFFGEL